ncbi:hypothetical protein SNE35_24545 [Paucibacter sp. R3-3]|uniref:Excisionase n=1 Tax=Roseateles agri TaxID=3098619 RepID=A0ABU5DN13_9BURK|nr:hypothetical protein [Paucibacter sp. R3-3]MDY0747695.1 hypothetical protein [Paucibacter sp. R3-3]
MRDSIENKWLCVEILKEFGLPAAACQSMQFDDGKPRVVERLDRTWWTTPSGERRPLRFNADALSVWGLLLSGSRLS